jgi:hypothetical protein
MNTRKCCGLLPACGLALFLCTTGTAEADPLSQPPQEISSAVKRISDEAATVHNQMDVFNTSRARMVRTDANSTAQSIAAEGKRVANEMRHSYISIKGEKFPQYTEEQIKQAENEYALRAENALNSGSRNANAVEQMNYVRQRALMESAKNLQDQLLEPPSAADSIILQPRGTNLYVRNYQIVGEQYEKLPSVQPQRAQPYKGVYVAPNRAATGVVPAYTPKAVVTTPGSGWGNHVAANVRTRVTGTLMK